MNKQSRWHDPLWRETYHAALSGMASLNSPVLLVVGTAMDLADATCLVRDIDLEPEPTPDVPAQGT